MTTTPTTAAELYRENLLSGVTLRYAAESHASANRYGSVSGRRGWAHMVRTIGEYAALSDHTAQIAAVLLAGLPLYQTDHELAAKLYRNAMTAWAVDYDDVVGRSGPEGGRRTPTPHSLYDAVVLQVWLTEAVSKLNLGSATRTVGWATAALLVELNVQAHEVPAFAWPCINRG